MPSRLERSLTRESDNSVFRLYEAGLARLKRIRARQSDLNARQVKPPRDTENAMFRYEITVYFPSHYPSKLEIVIDRDEARKEYYVPVKETSLTIHCQGTPGLLAQFAKLPTYEVNKCYELNELPAKEAIRVILDICAAQGSVEIKVMPDMPSHCEGRPLDQLMVNTNDLPRYTGYAVNHSPKTIAVLERHRIIWEQYQQKYEHSLDLVGHLGQHIGPEVIIDLLEAYSIVA
jgi:hypothetical protein